MNLQKRPIFIEDDEALTEEKKETAFLEYMKHRFHHPSMTKIIEDKQSLTELKLEPTQPFTDEEWL